MSEAVTRIYHRKPGSKDLVKTKIEGLRPDVKGNMAVHGLAGLRKAVGAAGNSPIMAIAK